MRWVFRYMCVCCCFVLCLVNECVLVVLEFQHTSRLSRLYPTLRTHITVTIIVSQTKRFGHERDINLDDEDIEFITQMVNYTELNVLPTLIGLFF